MPREPLDAAENLPEEAPCQVALGQLQDEVSGVPDEAPAGLEQPLLQAREGPTLDNGRQDEPAQEIADVVGDDAENQAKFVGRKRWQESRVQCVASFPSLTHCFAVPRWL